MIELNIIVGSFPSSPKSLKNLSIIIFTTAFVVAIACSKIASYEPDRTIVVATRIVENC